MKKLLCALLALTLLCTLAFATEGELIPAYSIEAPENPRTVAIGETGVEISLPGNWVDAEAPEDSICAYASPDGDMTLTVALAAPAEEVYASGLIDEVFKIKLCRMETPAGWQYFYL